MKINIPTAITVIVAILALAGLAAYKVEPAVIAAVAGAFVAVAGALKQLAEPKGGDE